MPPHRPASDQNRSAWSHDGWLLFYPALCVNAAIWPAISFRFGGPLAVFVSTAFAFAILVVAVPLLFYTVVARRPKRAMSVVAGMALVLSVPWTLPIIDRTIDTVAFWMDKAAFDRLVASERAKQRPPGQSVRMVVEYEDRSLFALDHSVEFVIYDETDGARTAPDSVTGFWPCPGSDTGVISVDGEGRSIRHVVGHYYRVFSS